jgi:hypothetical protein
MIFMGYVKQNIIKIGPQEHGQDTVTISWKDGLNFRLSKKG